MLVNQTTYDSFGQVLSETNSLFGDRYKFTGRELNSGNDYYYRARTYNASQGRFGSLDPAGFAAETANVFSYVFNSPSNFTDPTGLVTSFQYSLILSGSIVGGCTVGLLANGLFTALFVDSSEEAAREFGNKAFNRLLGALLLSGARISVSGLAAAPSISLVILGPYAAFVASAGFCATNFEVF